METAGASWLGRAATFADGFMSEILPVLPALPCQHSVTHLHRILETHLEDLLLFHSLIKT